jgi:hypothetical protein
LALDPDGEAYASFSRMRDQEVKFPLLMGGSRLLVEALKKDLRLEAEEATTCSQVRLWMVCGGVLEGSRFQWVNSSRVDQPVCWQCGSNGHLGENAYRKAPIRTVWEEIDRDQKNEQDSMRNKALGSSLVPSHYELNMSARRSNDSLNTEHLTGDKPCLITIDTGA